MKMKVQKSVSLPLNDVFEVLKMVKNRKYASFSSFVRMAIREKLKNENIVSNGTLKK